MAFSIGLRSKLNILKQCSVNNSIFYSISRQTLCSNVVRPYNDKLNSSFYNLWPSSRSICYSSSQTLNIQECSSYRIPCQQWSSKPLLGALTQPFNTKIRTIITVYHVDRPSPETCKKNLIFKVHYPEDGKYTIEPLRLSKLAGRDPETGRIIFGKLGGGHKRKYRWVVFNRVPAGSKDPRVEKVIHVQYDPNRTARIALVGHEDQLRFIIATANMKKGDIITSTRHLPKMPISANEGDAHPVGALTVGTRVCCVETLPGTGPCFKIAAGTSGQIVQKLGQKMVVQVNQYKEYALDPNCLATVGQVSTPLGIPKRPIGSAQRMRWLGIRPGSGLFQKKTSRFGFRRKYKQPVKHMEVKKEPLPIIRLTLPSEEGRKVTPSTNRVS